MTRSRACNTISLNPITSKSLEGAQSDFWSASALGPESVSSDSHPGGRSEGENRARAVDQWRLSIGAPRQLAVVRLATQVAFKLNHRIKFTPTGIAAWESGRAVDSIAMPT